MQEAQKAKQLTLFEGYEVALVEQKIKTGTLTVDAGDKDPRTAKLYHEKCFVVKAKAVKVIHGDKDDQLTRTVEFEVLVANEISLKVADPLLYPKTSEGAQLKSIDDSK